MAAAPRPRRMNPRRLMPGRRTAVAFGTMTLRRPSRPCAGSKELMTAFLGDADERAISRSRQTPEQSLGHRPIQGPVERPRQAVEHLVDLMCGDDQRRAKRQGVAGERAHDQALRLGKGDAARADALLRLERLLGALVRDHLEAADEAEAARFADQRML